MSEHTHTTLVDGCYRCELNRDEMRDASTPSPDMVEQAAAFRFEIPNGWTDIDFAAAFALSVRADTIDEFVRRFKHKTIGQDQYDELQAVAREMKEDTEWQKR